ncbi:MAG: hypothetical protein J0I19_14040 [Alphaproteobacteria bacterium]|nr:hypothetical protein [Alphaproteobacteria bacterium]
MTSDLWPRLDFPEWRDTAMTLQLWMQVVGKTRLELTPWLNHSWQVPFYVTARGLGTSLIPSGSEAIDLEFDLLQHRLVGRGSRGAVAAFDLTPMPVADFYANAMLLLQKLDAAVTINPVPSELPDPVAFADDRRPRSYDAEAVHHFWRVLLQADRLLKHFRTGFLGKASPVHLFWGGFDLAVTRFSGRRAPLHPGGIPGLSDRVTREAYSHEVSSAGFWPGSDVFPRAAFYSYAYPQPQGFETAAIPDGAHYDATLGEFILPYDTVRAADDPDALVMAFLQATYAAAASLGAWNRDDLECDLGVPNRPRMVRG